MTRSTCRTAGAADADTDTGTYAGAGENASILAGSWISNGSKSDWWKNVDTRKVRKAGRCIRDSSKSEEEKAERIEDVREGTE
jgi:hypothetical protein